MSTVSHKSLTHKFLEALTGDHINNKRWCGICASTLPPTLRSSEPLPGKPLSCALPSQAARCIEKACKARCFLRQSGQQATLAEIIGKPNVDGALYHTHAQSLASASCRPPWQMASREHTERGECRHGIHVSHVSRKWEHFILVS